MSLDQKWMVIDVESIGLHGEAFAVAWVVVARTGLRLAEGMFAVDPSWCRGTDESRQWVAQHVPDLPATHGTGNAMRDAFWNVWQFWRAQGAHMAADCAWPVEARFLASIVNDDHATREWQGPYPLHEVASIVLTSREGRRPRLDEGSPPRQPDELPEHHPLMDARYSARQLIDALDRIEDLRNP